MLRAVIFIAACVGLYLAPYPVQRDMSFSRLATLMGWPVSDLDAMVIWGLRIDELRLLLKHPCRASLHAFD